MFKLRFDTPEQWTQTVLSDFDSFLLDHAACEKKASGMAMSMVAHYPDKPVLVSAMIELAIEELNHFKEVNKLLQTRGLVMAKDEKDPYVGGFRQHIRHGLKEYFLDRLIVAGIVESRGFERFGLVANGLCESESQLKKFYKAITRSEERHAYLFIELAEQYFPSLEVQTRLDELLDLEAEVVRRLPIRAKLH